MKRCAANTFCYIECICFTSWHPRFWHEIFIYLCSSGRFTCSWMLNAKTSVIMSFSHTAKSPTPKMLTLNCTVDEHVLLVNKITPTPWQHHSMTAPTKAPKPWINTSLTQLQQQNKYSKLHKGSIYCWIRLCSCSWLNKITLKEINLYQW